MVQSDSATHVHLKAGDGGSIPVASMVESIVGCKWSVRILQLCAEGHHRPSELLRACPGLSAKVMNERLRKMTRFGTLRRTVFGEKPPVEVEYRLTPFGLRFMGILQEVRRLQEDVERGLIRDAGMSQAGVRQRDLGDVAGTWQEDSEFDQAIAEQDSGPTGRQIPARS